MATRADLNIIVNLISAVKEQLPALKTELEGVGNMIQQMVNNPRWAGKGFSDLFKLDGKSIQEQIQIIRSSIDTLKQNLANVDIQKALFGKEIDTSSLNATLDAIGNQAIQKLQRIEEEKVAIAKKGVEAQTNAVKEGLSAEDLARQSQVQKVEQTQSEINAQIIKAVEERIAQERKGNAEIKAMGEGYVNWWKEILTERAQLDAEAAQKRAAQEKQGVAEVEAMAGNYVKWWQNALNERNQLSDRANAEMAAREREYSALWSQLLNDREKKEVESYQARAAAQKAALSANAAIARESANTAKGYAEEAERAIAQAAKTGSVARTQAAMDSAKAAKLAAEESAQAWKMADEQIALAATSTSRVQEEAAIKASAAYVKAAEEAAQRSKVAMEKAWAGIGKPGASAFGEVSNAMTQLSYKLTHVGFQLEMFGAMALEAFKAPVEVAAELNKVIQYTAAISQEGISSYNALRDASKEMAQTSVFSAQQAAEGLQTLVQAGYSAADSIKALPAILNLAAAGMTDVDTAVKLTVATLNTYGMGLNEIERVTNIIAAGANTTSADVTTFGNALKFVGPLAHQVGVSLEETVAMLGQFHQNGIRGSMAGTSFTNIMRVLLNPTAKAAAEIKRLGINIKDADGSIKPMGQLLDEFSAGLDKVYGSMAAVDRQAALNRIFGVRGGPAFTAALQLGSKGLKDVSDRMKEQADNAAIAAEMSEGLWGKLEKLGNAFKNFQESVGNMGGPLKFLIELLTKLVNAVTTAVEKSPEIKLLASAFMTLIAVAGGLASIAGTLTLFGAVLTSALGLLGPLGSVFGIVAVNAEAAALATAQAGKQMYVATPAAAALGAALKTVVASLAGIIGAIEIIRFLYQLYNSFKDTNEQIENGTKKYERFKDALREPIKTKEEFAILSEDEKRKEIRRLSEIQRAYQGSIQDIETRILRKEFWGFLAPGDLGQMKQELAKMKREYEASIDAEKYYKLHVYDDKAKAEDVKKVEDALSTVDEILGNKTKGIKGVGNILEEQIKTIENTASKYVELSKSIGQTGEATEKYGETSLQILTDVEGKAKEVAASEAADAEAVTQAKIDSIDAYFQYYMGKLDEAEGVEGASAAKILEAREKIYEDTLTALDNLYAESIAKEQKYVEDVIKAEDTLAKKKVELYEWAQKQMGADDSVKSDLQKFQEAMSERERIYNEYIKAQNDGNTKLQEQLFEKLKKVTEEAVKTEKKYWTDLAKEKEKLEEDLEKKKQSLADAREQRERKAQDATTKYYDAQGRAIDSINNRDQAAADRHEAAVKRLTAAIAAAERAEDTASKKTASSRLAAEERVRKARAALAAENEKYAQDEARRAKELGAKQLEYAGKIRDAKGAAGEDTAAQETQIKLIQEAEKRLQEINTLFQNTQSEIGAATRLAVASKAAFEALPTAEKDLQTAQAFAKTAEQINQVVEIGTGLYTENKVIAEEKLRLQREQTKELGEEKKAIEAMNPAAEAVGAAGEKGIKKWFDAIAKGVSDWGKQKLGLSVDPDPKTEKLLDDLKNGKPFEVKVQAQLTPEGKKTVASVTDPKGGTAKITVAPIDWSKNPEVQRIVKAAESGKLGEATVSIKAEGGAAATQMVGDVQKAVDTLKQPVTITVPAPNVSAATAAITSVGTAARDAGQQIDRAMGEVESSVSGAEDATARYSETVTKLTEAINAQKPWIPQVDMSLMESGFEKFAGNVQNYLSDVVEGYRITFAEVGASISSWWDSEMAAWATDFENLWNGWKTIAVGIGDWFVGQWNTIWGFWSTLAKDAWTAWSQFIVNLVEGVWSAIKASGSQLWSEITDVGNKIFNSFFDWLNDLFFGSFFSKLKNKLDSLVSWIRGVIGWAEKAEDAANDAARAKDRAGKGRFGGLVAFVQGMAQGGQVQKMAGGGKLPGYGGGDRRLVLLEDGEYIMPKESVRSWGVDLLNWMRASTLKGLPSYSVTVPRMAAGGSVGGSAAANNLPTVNLNLNFSGKSYALKGTKNVVDQLTEALRRESLTAR
jgi:TP901 family phage tail tape measure protein